MRLVRQTIDLYQAWKTIANKELLTTPKAPASIRKSIFLAVSSATICSVTRTAVAAAARKAKGFFRKSREGVSLLSEMLPGIVLVIGIMLLWNAIYKVIPLYNRAVR